MGLGERPKFWYVTDKEDKRIQKFYEKHLHPKEFGGTIPRCPYHLEIVPNSVSYTVTVVCDICIKKKFKKLRKIEWFEDITDYDSW